MFWPLPKMRTASTRFSADEQGATAIEYGLIVAGIAIAIVIVVFTVGNSIENVFAKIRGGAAICDEKSSASSMGIKMGKGHGCK